MNKKILTGFIIFSGLLLAVDPAYASGTVGSTIIDFANNLTSIPTATSFIAYILGAYFVLIAMIKAKDNIEFGHQKAKVSEFIAYFFAGGLLVALPSVAKLLVTTLALDAANSQTNTGWSLTAATPSGGLDSMMINFMSDIHGPLTLLITFFCYIAGIIITLICLNRLTKISEQGPTGPSGLGTLTGFIIAGLLMSFGPSLALMSTSLFNTNQALTRVSFLALDPSLGAASDNAVNVLSAILAFLMIVGIISVVKGLFVIRSMADGSQNATMLSGFSHLIAGAILVNFGQFANIIQNTLGIVGYGVLFN